jgi:Holliday junction resolvase RusA-like endonuclease
MRLVARVEALGVACVPWSVPEIGNGRTKTGRKFRFTTRNKALDEWQSFVRAEAGKAMKGRICLGPVMLRIDFFRRTPPGARHGQLWQVPVTWNDDKQKFTKDGKAAPDLVNLFKGTEDAMENVIYGNDVQTCILFSRRLYGPLDGIVAEVFEIQPGDYPGHEAA